jgi:exopolysaccharide production protein ExoY
MDEILMPSILIVDKYSCGMNSEAQLGVTMQMNSLREAEQPVIFAKIPLALEEVEVVSSYEVCKRMIDVVGALIGMLLLLLLLPIVAIWIFLEDRGPIFYRQTRVGINGRPFSIYKFRTMFVDADGYLARHPELRAVWEVNGKLQSDPRITRIGRFLRRTSLDEMPQMINVLRGEMSLVGPRAIQFSEVSVFKDLYELRQTVKPGVTGLWQISGRSTTDYNQRGVLDCMYVMNRSLAMDIYIIFMTLPIIFYGSGAY